MPRYSDSNSQSSSPKRPQRSTRRQQASPRKHTQTQNTKQNKTVYVTNLPGGTKVDDIKQMFEKEGKIASMNVVDKQSYSNAFINYEECYSAQNAIKNLNGTLFKEKNLKCQPARPPKPKEYNRPRENYRNDRPREESNKGRSCFQCGKEGHFKRDCPNQSDRNNNDRPRRYEDRRDSHRQSRKDQRYRGRSEDSIKESPKKRRDRKRSSSSSSPPRKSHRKRERSDSGSVHRNKRRDSPRKRRTPSSSRSYDRRRDRKHNRSRSAELRKGKRRQVSRSSSSR